VKLYDYFRSSAAYRVRIALNLKGLSPSREFVHLRKNVQRSDDYLAVNPEGLVPALVIEGGQVLTQSLAIIDYLDETVPHPPLLPATPADCARVRGIALAIACDIHPLNNLRVLLYLKNTLGVDDVQKDAWYKYWIDVGLELLSWRRAHARGHLPRAATRQCAAHERRCHAISDAQPYRRRVHCTPRVRRRGPIAAAGRRLDGN